MDFLKEIILEQNLALNDKCEFVLLSNVLEKRVLRLIRWVHLTKGFALYLRKHFKFSNEST